MLTNGFQPAGFPAVEKQQADDITTRRMLIAKRTGLGSYAVTWFDSVQTPATDDGWSGLCPMQYSLHQTSGDIR